ncbi:hypothetical protein BKA67DRAFT_673741 [Truncatella angustata]|uniref:Ubiquitin-like protease family profile domain-containing protein n=1 Tax=Truncatella angustata TaxID=152316 RepID=A0A9P8UT10_9PEZI|nr:uncharacterized protein BKA67DRAFT_673741 [Truncatella angustata]KAH6657942.1 hypothetical protein BKA67DRAFT_673741 [Truncatella angustata]KAH8195907.1 hypothetical protein TruAng_009920 [Truncatella angustata]
MDTNRLQLPADFKYTTMEVLDNGFILPRPPARVKSKLETIEPEAYWGYQSVSSTHNAPINGYAVDVSVEYEFGFLHEDAQHLINLKGTWLDSINLFHVSASDSVQKHLEEVMFRTKIAMVDNVDPQFFAHMKRRRYTIMPINTGDHWMTLFLHLEREAGVKRREGFTKVKSVTVIDPNQHVEMVGILERRVELLLESKGFTFAKGYQRRHIKTVLQKDMHSCGLHVYSTMKSLLHRVDHMVRREKVEYSETLWEPLHQKRFVAEKVRAKMRGICAEVFLKEHKGNVRAVFVETRGVIPHGQQKAVPASSILYPNSVAKRVDFDVEHRCSTLGKRKQNFNDTDDESDHETPAVLETGFTQLSARPRKRRYPGKVKD